MSDALTPRRTFLGQLALTTVGLSGVARAAAAETIPADTVRLDGSEPAWDDSWTKRLGSTHRFVFDLPQEGNASMVLGQMTSLYDDYHTALDTRDQDMHCVLVIRHAAIAMILNDAMWAKYKVGDANPQRAPLAAWQARGVAVLACNVALMNRARQFASATTQERSAVEEELRQNILPDVILQPNGVYAVHRAQDAGCTLYHGGS